MTQKIVINVCFGGFSLSPAAELKLWEQGVLKAVPIESYYSRDLEDESIIGHKRQLQKWREFQKAPAKRDALFINVYTPDEKSIVTGVRDLERNNPALIAIVEEMGDAADGACAKLHVVEIPDGVEWEIDEYDGSETIDEKHRSWR